MTNMKIGLVFLAGLMLSGCETFSNQAYYQSIYDRCVASGRDDFYCSEYSNGIQRRDQESRNQAIANYWANQQQINAQQYQQASQNLNDAINRPAGITNTNCRQDVYGNVNCTSNSW